MGGQSHGRNETNLSHYQQECWQGSYKQPHLCKDINLSPFRIVQPLGKRTADMPIAAVTILKATLLMRVYLLHSIHIITGAS